jgi:PPM family protein phosphatase
VEEEVAVTPGFSAPELLTGMGTRDGESADLFSLGMFLYFLVAGEIPPASVYTRYAPAIPARNFRPGFPPGLHSVISRATRPRPEDRYASVQTMLDAFEAACEVVVQRACGIQYAPPAMRLAAETHIGIAKRRRNPTNQDHVFSGCSDDGRFALVVVADGVSTASYGSGDLASKALADAAAVVWEDILPTYLMDESVDDVEVIQRILRRANHQIVDQVNENHAPFHGSPHEVMGSTALVALIINGQVTVGALGDSRVYLQRGAGMEQMTIDHNLWTLSILEGVHADSALAMPHGDALARCLGTFVVEQGTLRAVDPQPDVFRFRIIDGDTLLLTTDGLVDFAGANQLTGEDNILSVLLAEPDPALACLELILLANRGGGGDNIGLSVVRFF